VSVTPFDSAIAQHIWDTKYRWRRAGEALDETIDDTWRRVASALAGVEERRRQDWADRFCDLLRGFRFLPGGRILAGAGTEHRVTLFNCFVMGRIDDSMDGIFDSLKESAITMQQGGGVGLDFSTLRPAGSVARTTGTVASGPISFMRIWDAMCATLLSTGARRGAMMATLRCDHPDVEHFIEAKGSTGELTHFNLSVLVTDDFLEAARRDADWPLVFPDDHLDDESGGLGTLERCDPGGSPSRWRVLRIVRARELWRTIMRATYEHAEPGVLFIDRINRCNNLAYRERISATNPCGEVPLPPYGACNLGSFNLTCFVKQAFTSAARFDFDALRSSLPAAVRLLDNVIDASRFPLPVQEEQAKGARRLGLGVTGLADALVMLGLRYDEADGRRLAAEVMRTLCHEAYAASCELATEKGAFPFFDAGPFLAGEFARTLPAELRRRIAKGGLRNSHLTAIAPTGTISLLAGNVSSGLEPIFANRFTRRVLELDGSCREIEVTDAAFRSWRDAASPDAPLPTAFVTANELPPEAHLEMQAALQPFVDQAISKTIHVPVDFTFDDFAGLYDRAYDLGLKGCTTYRPTPVRGAVLSLQEAEPGAGTHCCGPEREPD